MSAGLSNVQRVRLAFQTGAYRFTDHAEREREADAVSIHEVEQAFQSASVELLEEYPDDPRGASALFLGFTDDARPVHAVVGLSSPELVVVITIYRPQSALWYDWRRRA